MNVDIIIPIYNAFDFVDKCIQTVIKYTNLTKHTLLLINDKSTDERILPLLNSFVKTHPFLNIKLINNVDNQGFVRTVNIGMRYSDQDVILLNSDTEVTKNWIHKIQTCAYSKPAIATVTPLSNNATLASVPNFMVENELPSHLSVEEYAELVEKCSMNLFPEIPTANGFCMYIRREAIDNIGLFDEAAFGKGYGEENDFSYRCLQAGYRHLLCDNTYIYHKGSQSFSQEKVELMNSHLQVLKERYSSCVENTETFVEQNPLVYIQLNIRYAINLYSLKNVLIVVHEFKDVEEKNIGGTTLHVHDLIKSMRKNFNFHVLYYSSEDFKYHVTSFFLSDKITITLEESFVFTTFNLYNDIYKKHIEMLVEVLKIDLIHIHHLKYMYLDIFEVAEKRNIPIIYTLHDFYSICPSITLFDESTFICNYLEPENCRLCIAKKFNLNASSLFLWRKMFHKSLKTSKKNIVPSYGAKNIFLSVYKDLEIQVIEHGYEKINKKFSGNPIISNEKRSNKFNIAFIGNISEEKGLKYLKEIIPEVKGTNIVVHLFGKADSKEYNKNRQNYIYHGRYLQKDLPGLLIDNDIKVICLLSICHETYSYTLSESLICQIPVITLDLGAIAERTKTIDAGWVLPRNSTANDIFRLIWTIKSNHSGEYKQKKENIRYFLEKMKSLDDMAVEYTNIYNNIINAFPVLRYNMNDTQAKLDFYQKSDCFHPVNVSLREAKKEYKRIKRIIKSPISFKQAFEEVQNYRATSSKGGYRNRILFKFILYRILHIS